MNRRETAPSPPFDYHILWQKDYPEGGGHMGVAIDSLNNIVVCGINKDESQGVVVKYDPEGRELWSDHDFPVPLCMAAAGKSGALPCPRELSRVLGTDYGYFFDLVVDGENNIVVAGTFIHESGKRSAIFVKKYRPDGTTLWETTHTPLLVSMATCVDVDSRNNVLIAGGGSTPPRAFQAFVMKLSALTGRRLWRRTHREGPGALYTDLTVDRQDTIYTAGFTTDGSQVRLLLAKMGGLLGGRRRTFTGAQAAPASLALAPDEGLIVVGKTERGEDTHYILLCSRHLQQQWEVTDSIPGFLYGSTIYGDAYLAATGARSSLNRYYAALYELRTGQHLMDLDLGPRVSGRLDDYLRGIAVDTTGDLVMVGARTVGRTLKVRLTESGKPLSPSPAPPSPPPAPPSSESWLERVLRWLTGLWK